MLAYSTVAIVEASPGTNFSCARAIMIFNFCGIFKQLTDIITNWKVASKGGNKLEKKSQKILLKIKSEIEENSRTAIRYGKYQKVILTDLVIQIIEKHLEAI